MKERNLNKAIRLERMLLSSSDNKHIHVLCQDPCLEYHFGIAVNINLSYFIYDYPLSSVTF
jgi:hypothetical protein